ncbi:MAG: hypothetical protein HY535_05430 [Chloroflexi bacterium]|nr:hypothetical protein [Chloroflexota bacterium]
MAIRGGYRGRLLEVDLTERAVRAVPLPPEDVVRRWVGCAGLGLHLLSREVTPSMQPTDPECPLFILTGPLTGTLVPSSSNWTIVSLNGLVHYHVGISHGHGYWGARLKHAGWDGITVRGASSAPVYLWIDDDRVELRDAGQYWGLDTFETARRIQEDHRDPANISVACIGPAGENLVAGASVRSDGSFGASKGAPGIVWGAKKLKAIAVRGTGEVPVAEPDQMVELSEEWRQTLEASPKPPSKSGADGLLIMQGYAMNGRVMGKNLTDPEVAAEWGRHLAEDVPQWKLKPVGSWRCDIQCHSEGTITTGPMTGCPFRGYVGTVMEAMGPNLGITEPGVSVALARLLDASGLDCSEVPAVIAMLMEAYSKGLLTLEDTDGLDLQWGNYEAVIELLDRIVRREGIGATIAQGLRATAQQFGVGDMAVHIKGMGYTEHDPRVRGIPLVFQYILSGAGPARQVALTNSLPDLGLEGPTDLNDPAGKGEFVARSHALKMWQDTTGVCLLAAPASIKGMLGLEARAVRAAVGWEDFQAEEATLVGERIANLLRLLSLFRGHKPEFERDFSPRLVEPVPSGPARGRVGIGPHFASIREQYYRALGWDLRTGAPGLEALQRVGLADYPIGRQQTHRAPTKGTFSHGGRGDS